jgi:hypothetical protein
MAALTPCKNDKDTPSMVDFMGQDYTITDGHLNSDGVFKFNKMMRIKYPDEIDDFDPSNATSIAQGNRYFRDHTLSDSIVIDLS